MEPFRLGQYGRSFATRERGAELREELLARWLPMSGELTIDFDGVQRVSYSFADELVGRLAAEHDVSVSIANARGAVASVVERATSRRLGAVA